MANEVSVDIDVNTKSAIKSIDKLEKSFSDFSEQAVSETKKATGAMDTFNGVLGAQAAIGGLKALGSAAVGLFNVFITDGIKAAQVQEDAINSLNIALKASGKFTEEASKDFQAYASELQTTSKFGDEAILTNAALIQSLGQLEGDALKGATKSALDLSAALGISLNSAATLVGKAAAGEVGSFSRFGLSIKKGADNAETFANALEGINSKFGGAAAGQVKTFSGASTQLSNTFGDLTETFGFFVTKNDLVVAAITGLNKGIAQLDTFVKNNEKTIQEFINNGLLSIVDAIQPLGKSIVFINDVFVGLATTWDFLKIGLNELVGLFISGTGSILDAAKATQEFLGLDTTGVDEAIASITLMKEVSDEVTQEMSDGIDKRLEAQQQFADGVNGVADTVANAIRKEITLERVKTKVVQEETQKQVEAKTVAVEKVLSDEEKLAAKLAEIQKKSAEKKIEEKAKEILALQEMELADSTRKEEERLIKVELDTEQADERLELLVSRLGQEEAIRSEAEARVLAKEGKVAQAKKKRDLTDLKAKKENIFAFQKFEDLTQKQRVANLQSTFGTIASLSNSNNKALAATGKAAAISQATIDGFAAVQKALASAPPPFNLALAGIVGAATAANVAKIAGVKGFQGGGVVGGVPQDRDNQSVNVASGEVILNRRQQAETLFQIANGQGGDAGGGGGMNISIEAGVGGVSDEQVDNLITQINDRVEFGNQALGAA